MWDAKLAGRERLRFTINVLTRLSCAVPRDAST